jgi:hypothetical protein
MGSKGNVSRNEYKINPFLFGKQLIVLGGNNADIPFYP